MSDELHIASLVVHVAPASLTGVAQAVTGVDGLVLHGTHPAASWLSPWKGLAPLPSWTVFPPSNTWRA
jgi:hypothetical protein